MTTFYLFIWVYIILYDYRQSDCALTRNLIKWPSCMVCVFYIPILFYHDCMNTKNWFMAHICGGDLMVSMNE